MQLLLAIEIDLTSNMDLGDGAYLAEAVPSLFGGFLVFGGGVWLCKKLKLVMKEDEPIVNEDDDQKFIK